MEPAMILLATLFGAVVGSFLNVVILRLPKDDASIVFPGSHCPQCLAPLNWYENIPILSYLVLRGRCRTCKVHISLQYPMVELSMAVLTAILYHRLAFTFEFFFYFVFFAALPITLKMWHAGKRRCVPSSGWL